MNPEMAIGIVVGLLRWKRKSLERVPAFDPPSRVDEEDGDVVPELEGLRKNRKPVPLVRKVPCCLPRCHKSLLRPRQVRLWLCF